MRTARPAETKGAWLRFHGLSADQVRDILAAIPDVLGAEPLTREQLADKIVTATGHADLRGGLTQGFGALLKPAAAKGLLCFGPPRGRNVTFVAPRRWLRVWSDVDSDAALESLVLAHLDAYGPADPAELTGWFSLNPPPVKRAFARLGDRLAWVDVAGRTGAIRREHLESLLDPPAEPTVHLLPAFDPYVVGSLRQLDHVLTGGGRSPGIPPAGLDLAHPGRGRADRRHLGGERIPRRGGHPVRAAEPAGTRRARRRDRPPDRGDRLTGVACCGDTNPRSRPMLDAWLRKARRHSAPT